MTYCVAVMLDAGMVFASDSRTNAGVDQISTFSKMHMIKRDGERLIVVLSSGNLSITQSAINLLEHQSKSADSEQTINNATSMFEIADLIGNALREVRRRDGPYLAQSNIEAHASFVVGGQIKGETQRLFHVYSEGNFIEATPETPYFQIGESKYGKPVIDRVLHNGLSLRDAVKLTLVSFDSTMRSNVSVGPPIDLLVYENNALAVRLERRIDEGDPFFGEISRRWDEGLKQAFAQTPEPDWL